MTPSAQPPERARELIARLNLQPHPERGYYAETYRSPLTLQSSQYGAERCASTAIYFLISAEAPSTYLHRLRSDELFHLYEGGPLEVLLLRDGEPPRVHVLGLDLSAGQTPQLVIEAGTWFGCELASGVSHCLFGCTVAPGFEFVDFELAQGGELALRFPSEAARIGRMSRPDV